MGWTTVLPFVRRGGGRWLRVCGIRTTDTDLCADYRETAVKFQKEWRVQEPHRQLDFAPYVKSHALVNVLNKGLLYHSLEREHAETTKVRVKDAREFALMANVSVDCVQ